MKNLPAIPMLICAVLLSAIGWLYNQPMPNKTAKAVESTPALPARKGTDEITVFCAGRDLRPIITHFNSLLAAESVAFRLADKSSSADLSIAFQDNIGDAKAVALSYPLLGTIYVSNSLPADQVYVVLIHEFLHCAGVGHEPDDAASVMYTKSQSKGHLKKRHAEALHRLAGIGIAGRVRAQLGLMGGGSAMLASGECVEW